MEERDGLKVKLERACVFKVLALSIILITPILFVGCRHLVGYAPGDTVITEDAEVVGDVGAGNDTGVDVGTGDDAGDPCNVIATPQLVAQVLGKSCDNIFGQSVCSFNNDFTKASFISAIMLGYVPPSQIQGYVNPSAAHFKDVPEVNSAYADVEKAHWLKLLAKEGSFFSPTLPASVCWTGPFLNNLKILPTVYFVVKAANPPDSLPPNWFWATSMTYTVYSSIPGNHFTDVVRVVNNLGGDFTVGQDEDSLAEVQIVCSDKDGDITEYSEVPALGVATFSSLNCIDHVGNGFDMIVQFKVSTLLNGANTGDKIRVAIDHTSVVLRGEGSKDTPTFLIE